MQRPDPIQRQRETIPYQKRSTIHPKRNEKTQQRSNPNPRSQTKITENKPRIR